MGRDHTTWHASQHKPHGRQRTITRACMRDAQDGPIMTQRVFAFGANASAGELQLGGALGTKREGHEGTRAY